MPDIAAPASPYRHLDDNLRGWMRRVMRERQWSAEHWARTAGVAGTTITRYLNATDPDAGPRRRPTSATVEKLAAAAGVPFTYSQEPAMSDADLELPDDEPEVFRLHSALGVAILALEMIADAVDGRHVMARAALNHLRRRHPVAVEHMSKSREIER